MVDIELTPSDLVRAAVEMYQAEAKPNGVSHVTIKFPSMHHATSWASAAEISGRVRLVMQHSAAGPCVGYLSEPVTVVYEF